MFPCIEPGYDKLSRRGDRRLFAAGTNAKQSRLSKPK